MGGDCSCPCVHCILALPLSEALILLHLVQPDIALDLARNCVTKDNPTGWFLASAKKSLRQWRGCKESFPPWQDDMKSLMLCKFVLNAKGQSTSRAPRPLDRH